MVVIDSEWVIIGKLGRPQGVRGLIRVHSYTEPRENILAYPNWYGQSAEGVWKPLKRSESSVTSQHILVALEGYVDRQAISILTNMLVAIPKKSLPPLTAGEYYWHELIGLQVIDLKGVSLGTIESILETGSNDVLVVVDDNKKRLLIPYLLHDVIKAVDLAKNNMTVDWDLE